MRPPRSAADLAAEALDRARDDPRGATAAALRALDLAGRERAPAAAVVAERALGLAARADGDLPASARHLRRAVRAAERHGLRSLAAQARVSLFGTLALRGDFRGALREADAAAEGLRGLDRARLELQRASVLILQGTRLDEALAGFRRALPALRRAGEAALEATALENRGLLHCYRGAMAAAEADLRSAERLRSALGQHRLVAVVRQNLGFVAARRGDLPAALAWFDRADEHFRDAGASDPVGLRDRCEALLRARLVAEARRTAERAVDALDSRRMGVHLAEARLMLAEAALLDGDPAAARDCAERAARAFARQRRPRHRQLARYLALKAVWQSGERPPGMLAAARRTAAALAESGWAAAAADLRVLAGRLAWQSGRPRVARRELAAAARERRRGPAELRVRAWHAEALLRLYAGDRAGADRALRAGMRLVERQRAALGAADLRAHASAAAAELAGLGLRLALDRGRPAAVLSWAERWRAGGLWAPPARPPDDRLLRADLNRLRRVVGELDRAALDGRPTGGLLTRQARLERAVQERARHAAGRGLVGKAGSPGARALAACLDGRALVELVEADGRLHAVTVVDGRARLTALGPAAPVAEEVAAVRFALRRLAHRRGPEQLLDAAAAAFAHGARRLDDLLLGPLRAELDERALVFVPTGVLHALPWAALPSCAGRPLTVAPSAALWRRARLAGDAAGDGRVLLAAGPDVPGAHAELTALSRRYPRALCLPPERSLVRAVTASLDGSARAHLVAHGRFRADNPLFSSLRLADGPLTVYDLEALDRPPSLLVLSACDSGLSDVRPGDELMGLVAALLASGTRTVIAPVSEVPDEQTGGWMVALHERLAAGEPPAVALASVQAGPADPGTGVRPAVGFGCFGAG